MKKLFVALVAFVLMTWLPVALAASCSVSEFSAVVKTASGSDNIQVGLMGSPSPVTQLVTATTPTAATNAFADTARFVWVYCDEVMHVQIGTAPATGLTTGDLRIPAGGFWIGLPAFAASLGTLKIAFCDIDCT